MMYDNNNVSLSLDSNKTLSTLVTNYQYFHPEMHC